MGESDGRACDDGLVMCEEAALYLYRGGDLDAVCNHHSRLPPPRAYIHTKPSGICIGIESSRTDTAAQAVRIHQAPAPACAPGGPEHGRAPAVLLAQRHGFVVPHDPDRLALARWPGRGPSPITDERFCLCCRVGRYCASRQADSGRLPRVQSSVGPREHRRAGSAHAGAQEGLVGCHGGAVSGAD